MIDETGEMETLREAFGSLAEDARPTDACPEPEKLWDGVRGDLPPDELRDVVDHISTCAACAEAWRIGFELTGEAREEKKAPERRIGARSTATPVWRRYAAAAAVVLGVVGVSQLSERSEQPARFRDAAVTGIVSAVSEDVPFARDACVLRWSLEPPVEGVRYELRVTTEDLDLVTEARDLESPSFEIPESDLARLAPGARLWWQVEAVLPDGGRLTSESFLVLIE